MKKLQTKDLIYSGGYAVLYMIVAMVSSMAMGVMPILTVYGFPLVAGVVCSCIYFLYAMKIKKIGAITILAVLLGIMSASGGHIYTIFLAIPIGALADFIAFSGKYKSKAMLNLSYVVFNFLTVTPMLSFLTAKEATLKQYEDYFNAEYAQAIDAIISNYTIYVQVCFSVLGAILGILFANRLLKKHFNKVGNNG